MCDLSSGTQKHVRLHWRLFEGSERKDSGGCTTLDVIHFQLHGRIAPGNASCSAVQSLSSSVSRRNKHRRADDIKGIATDDPVHSALMSSTLENNHCITLYYRKHGVNSVFLVQDGVWNLLYDIRGSHDGACSYNGLLASNIYTYQNCG